MLVMVVDDLLGVVHAAVTKFDGVPIEDFPKWVVYRKVFIYKGEEFVADVGADIFAVWRVVPEYVVPLSVSSVRGRFMENSFDKPSLQQIKQKVQPMHQREVFYNLPSPFSHPQQKK